MDYLYVVSVAFFSVFGLKIRNDIVTVPPGENVSQNEDNIHTEDCELLFAMDNDIVWGHPKELSEVTARSVNSSAKRGLFVVTCVLW